MRNTFSIEVIPEPCAIVIFGATGDLSRRKIMPSLCRLFTNNLLHEASCIIACGRSEKTTSTFRNFIKPHVPKCICETEKCRFLEQINYVRADPADLQSFKKLAEYLNDMECSGSSLNHLFYFAVPPTSTAPLVTALSEVGLMKRSENSGWLHLAIEKPFGEDLESAIELDRFLHSHLKEDDIFRIDHFLAKKTVQNILITRFANRIFESLWDKNSIDHIQIRTSETVGLEGRTAYFDRAGLLRDMFQNHLMEILMLIAMEPPESFDAPAIHKAKLDLIKSIRPFTRKRIADDIIRAQYSEGNGMPGYRQEEGIDDNSMTETFVRMKMLIDNERWEGVPFYLQAGKRMAHNNSEITIVFKRSSYKIFREQLAESLTPNTLTLRLRPNEGMKINLQSKHSGPKMAIGNMQFNTSYEEQSSNPKAPDDYARLLLDAMLHDHTLFVRGETIIESWRLFTTVLEAWNNEPQQYPLLTYPAGAEDVSAR
ncbi:MAG: glucose-6-phosphate dehydrogenase [Kiritimatiellia bacterium]